MSNVINLGRYRKKKARAEKEARAEENRVKFGRRKGDVTKEKAEKKKQEDHLDGHRKGDGES